MSGALWAGMSAVVWAAWTRSTSRSTSPAASTAPTYALTRIERLQLERRRDHGLHVLEARPAGPAPPRTGPRVAAVAPSTTARHQTSPVSSGRRSQTAAAVRSVAPAEQVGGLPQRIGERPDPPRGIHFAHRLDNRGVSAVSKRPDRLRCAGTPASDVGQRPQPPPRPRSRCAAVPVDSRAPDPAACHEPAPAPRRPTGCARRSAVDRRPAAWQIGRAHRNATFGCRSVHALYPVFCRCT